MPPTVQWPLCALAYHLRHCTVQIPNFPGWVGGYRKIGPTLSAGCPKTTVPGEQVGLTACEKRERKLSLRLRWALLNLGRTRTCSVFVLCAAPPFPPRKGRVRRNWEKGRPRPSPLRRARVCGVLFLNTQSLSGQLAAGGAVALVRPCATAQSKYQISLSNPK